MQGSLTAVQKAVLDWAASDGRELPWRRTRDPWAVLVSEVMLQQTQVARVVPVYLSFLARFPTTAACAEASVAAVVRAWAGLGYNRRAVSLHRAASEVAERHGGALPADLAALQALPGIGPYTARAVLAFAFEDEVGVVETNSARVLARAVAGRRLGRAEAQALADRLVPPGRAFAWNSAMLDLGATRCTSRSPSCDRCPLRGDCVWARGGWPHPDPARGSAGTTGPQSTFAGSDREGRGRLVAMLRAGPLPMADAARVAGWPDEPERARRMVAGLVADGLAVSAEGWLSLP